MSEWECIDKKLIPQINFESTEIIEFPVQPEVKADYRVTNNDLSDMPTMTPNESMKQLRTMLPVYLLPN